MDTVTNWPLVALLALIDRLARLLARFPLDAEHRQRLVLMRATLADLRDD